MSVDTLASLLAPLELEDRRLGAARLERAFLDALVPDARDPVAVAQLAKEIEAHSFDSSRGAGAGTYDALIAAYAGAARAGGLKARAARAAATGSCVASA